MKFIHISDLHIGKLLSGIDLYNDQEFILKQIGEIAVNEQADAVLIAGDIYNKSTPTGEAMKLFSDFMTFFVRKHIPVFAVSGNHDSSLKVSYFSSLIRDQGIYITEEFAGKLQKYTVSDEFGEIDIHLLPFVRPVYMKRFCPDKKINTYEDAVREAIDSSDIDLTKRNVLVCHQLITGANPGGSEELSIGGMENVAEKSAHR